MALQENVKFKRTCGSCRYFLGGGRNKCCDLMYDICYRVCHRNTVACELYEFRQATIDREEERRVKLAKWLREQVEKANRKMEG